MTRPPVLDALIWLQAEDYLQNDHNQIFYVKDWTAEDIKQTYEVRAMFAEHAALCWSQRSDDQCLAKLHAAVCAGMAALVRAPFDPEELTLSLRAFDQALVDLQGLKLLAKLNRQVTAPAQFRRTVRMLNKENFSEALLGRQRLLEAIVRRDVGWARSIARAMMLFLQYRLRWSRLFGQFGGEVKLIPVVIMPPVWSSDHGGHAPHDLFCRSAHRPLPGFAPPDQSAVAACCNR